MLHILMLLLTFTSSSFAKTDSELFLLESYYNNTPTEIRKIEDMIEDYKRGDTSTYNFDDPIFLRRSFFQKVINYGGETRQWPFEILVHMTTIKELLVFGDSVMKDPSWIHSGDNELARDLLNVYLAKARLLLKGHNYTTIVRVRSQTVEGILPLYSFLDQRPSVKNLNTQCHSVLD